MRSSPRSNSAFEVAYETRICSPVPKPSPGTVATCASRSSRPATSDARLHAAAPEERRNIRIDIERALRHRALHAGNRAQALHHVIAQLDVLAPHLLHALLRSLQRRHRGLLHDRSRIRRGLALQLRHRARHRRRSQRVAQAPAGHGVGFRKRSQHHHTLFIFAQRAHRKILARVIQIHVALVRKHPDAALVRQTNDLGHILRRSSPRPTDSTANSE